MGARAFSSSFIVSTTTMPLLFAVLFVGCLVFAPPLFLRVLGKFAVLYLCLKMMSMTIYAKREASKSSSLLLLLLSRKSRVRSRGRLAWSWCRLKKVALLFETLADGFFTGFVEKCVLYTCCFKKKCVKNVSKMSRVFRPIIFLIN